MSTKERRQRELAEREQLFLDTALELIRRDGLLNLQMSRIAEKCDYAVGTLYQHFTSKEDLLVALVTRYAWQRVDLFRHAVEWKAGTRDRMFGMVVADAIFVNRCPEHFRIAQYTSTEVVWLAASETRRHQVLEATKPICQFVNDIVVEAVKAGDLPPNKLKPAEIALALATLTQGMHTLVHAQGLMEIYDIRDPYRFMLLHCQILLNGFGWRPLFDTANTGKLERKIETLHNEVFCDSARATGT